MEGAFSHNNTVIKSTQGNIGSPLPSYKSKSEANTPYGMTLATVYITLVPMKLCAGVSTWHWYTPYKDSALLLLLIKFRSEKLASSIPFLYHVTVRAGLCKGGHVRLTRCETFSRKLRKNWVGVLESCITAEEKIVAFSYNYTSYTLITADKFVDSLF